VSALQAVAALKAAGSAEAIDAAVWNPAISPAHPDWVNFAVQAAAALGSAGDEKSAGMLLRLLRFTGPVAAAAVVSLAKLRRADPAQFFQETSSGIRFDSLAARRAWAAALGELGGDRAQFELNAMLMQAAQGQAESAESLAIPALLRALARAKSPELETILGAYMTSHDPIVARTAISLVEPASGGPAPWRPFLQLYSMFARDYEIKTVILNRLEPWAGGSEVQTFLRAALQHDGRSVRFAAARLLKGAEVSEFALVPGPSETRFTDQSYVQAAASRQDRTLAILDTSRGRIELELFREDAPLTVANFVSLANRGFFNGLSFMRVVPYFVIQGGDPRNDQEGGPGYAIRCEINMRPFDRGSVGMALSGKDTGGSQFFITLSPQPHLDGGYTCFGRVISGMPAAERMTAGDRIHKVSIVEDITMLDYRKY